eukprot:TRINITY_DN5171_c0_g1_i1.p1 TRINITY_DN5171_c0_g1~~TRINITY_DN5171_c0_g1_i1.p1  ORF type:complete len:498 (-),score=134.33 TRINITY_DN5171_c0_g1_i1:15-1508(-)
MKNHWAKFQESYENTQAKNNELENLLLQTKQNLETLESNNEDLLRNLKNGQSDNQKLQRERDEILEQLVELKGELKTAKLCSDNAESVSVQITSQYKELQRDFQAERSRYAELQTEYKSIKHEYDNFVHNIRNLEAENQRSTEIIATMRNELKESKTNERNLSMELRGLSEEKNHTTSLMSDAQQSIIEISTKYGSIKAECDEYKRKVETLSSENENLRENSISKSANTQMKSIYEQLVGELRGEMETIKAQNAKLAGDKKGLKEDYSISQNLKEEILLKYNNLQEEFVEMKNNYQNLLGDHNELQSKLSRNDQNSEKFTAEKRKLERTLENHLEQISDLESNLGTMYKKFQASEDKINLFAAELKQTRSERDKYKSKSVELNEMLQSHLELSNMQHNSSKENSEKIEALSEEISHYKNLIATKEKEMEATVEQYQSKNSEMSTALSNLHKALVKEKRLRTKHQARAEKLQQQRDGLVSSMKLANINKENLPSAVNQ